jgi:hypothetical protein
MFVIIFNSINIVPGSNNTKLRYVFPKAIKFEKNSQIALSSLNMFYSWYNINANLYSNNVFQYVWFNASGVLNKTITVTIPDGYYSIETLNEFVQSVLVTNGHYLTRTSDGKYIYHIEFVANPTYYSCQLNLYYMLASAESTGYVRGNTTWAFPTARTCPQVIINSTNNFKSLIDFKAGTFPAAQASTFQTFLSTVTPTLSPVSSLVLTCSLCQQDLATPDNVLYCFTAGQTIFGDTISSSPSALSFCNIREGSYNFIDLTIVDQNLNPMNIKDGQMIVMLTIRTLEQDSAYGKN